MKLPTAFRYGARCMVELATVAEHRPVSLRELAECQRVSAKYLEHIFRAMRAAGLVLAVRGMHGGYMLARPADRITLKEVYEALAGSTAPVECVDCPESCPMYDTCFMIETWAELKHAIDQVLSRTTLRELVDRKRRKQAAATQMYYI